MNLLDPNIQSYVIKWEGEAGIGFKLNAEIQNENGEKLGKIETKGLMTKKNYLIDIKNSEVLTAAKSSWSVGAKYDVKDSDNNHIGIVKQKVLSRDKNITMKNHNGDEILTFKGSSNLLGGNHEINLIDGKNIANFSVKQDVVKLSRWKGKTNNICTLKINDTTFDRKTILGMFISCLSSYLDYTKSEMQESIDTFKK